MAKTYLALQRDIAKLQKEAEAVRQKEVAGVVGRIKEAINTYGLTAQDLGLSGAGKPAAKARKAADVTPKGRRGAAAASRPAKYRDASGNTWGGRGPRPHWLRDALASGKQLQDFATQ